MKKILSVCLLLCLLVSLCACGETEPATTEAPTEAPTTEAPTEAPTEDDGMATYTAKVVDEGGNPIAGALVQICKDDCFPGMTDEQGVASFQRAETEGYKISFIELPAGYDYTTEETDFYFEGDAKELTITLKAVA